MKPFRSYPMTQANSEPIVVGIVHDPSGIIHVAAASSCDALSQALALWAVEQAYEKLSEAEREEVKRLVRVERFKLALRLYLRLVSERWDAERIQIERISVIRPPGVDKAPGP